MKTYSIEKNNGSWRMRWSTYIEVDGEKVRKQPVFILGPDTMKKSDVQTAAAEQWARITQAPTLEAGDTLGKFVSNVFFPNITKSLGKSVIRNYKQQWERLKPFVGDLTLRDVRTFHLQQAINAIHDKRGDTLSHEVYLHIRTTLTTMFAHAKRLGHYPGDANPGRDTSVSNLGHFEKRANGAYDLNEVKQYLTLFPSGDTAVAIAVNAFLALRRPEVEALLPEDFDAAKGLVRIHTRTKTHNDVWLPVAAELQRILAKGWATIDMAKAEAEIRRAIVGTSLQWKGWYAFRRGMMTNLYELHVPPEEACFMLRNTAEICKEHYLKLDAAKAKRAAIDKMNVAYEAQPVVSIAVQ
jgi:integrase